MWWKVVLLLPWTIYSTMTSEVWCGVVQTADWVCVANPSVILASVRLTTKFTFRNSERVLFFLSFQCSRNSPSLIFNAFYTPVQSLLCLSQFLSDTFYSCINLYRMIIYFLDQCLRSLTFVLLWISVCNSRDSFCLIFSLSVLNWFLNWRLIFHFSFSSPSLNFHAVI